MVWMKGVRGFLSFASVALFALGMVGANGNKQLGQQCTKSCQGSNDGPPCSDNCASGICKKWINAYYCTSALSKCAKSGVSGVSPGANHTHQGTDYQCKANVDNWGAEWVLRDGEQCSHDGECVGRCRNAITKKFCAANDKECGWGSSSGVDRFGVRTQSGVKYWCNGSSMKRTKSLGETCQSWNLGISSEGFQCASGNCARDVNGVTRCASAGKECYTPSGGIDQGQTTTVAGKTYLCESQSAGLRKVVANGELCQRDGDCQSGDCRQVETNTGQKIILNSGVCLAPGKKCPWIHSPGDPKGMRRGIGGKDHRCDSNGKWHEVKPNGVSCGTDEDCSSLHCDRAPNGSRYCRAGNMACAFPGTAGKPANATLTHAGKKLRCKQDSGWRLQVGEACALDGDCNTEQCKSGPVGGKFCKLPTKECAWPEISGLHTNATRAINGHTYRCKANGTFLRLD
ncbi:MAG: hypothetical protein H6716_23920 [Polyangiaceae bacterium]|nr:hypothetical protein [Polyangiaceae bacterium]